jgi:hypothetical protein
MRSEVDAGDVLRLPGGDGEVDGVQGVEKNSTA